MTVSPPTLDSDQLSWVSRRVHDLCEKLNQPWTSLRRIGTSKVAKSSAIWFLVIPLVVRVSSKLPDKVIIPITGNEIELVLDVPFSLLVLFFAAACFTIGNVLFVIGCPKIVEEYQDYDDFHRATGGSESEVRRHVFSIILGMQPRDQQGNAQYFMRTYCRIDSPDPGLEDLWDCEIGESQFPNGFAYARYVAGFMHRKWRVACTVAYWLGFLCLAWVFCTTVYSVVAYAIRSPFS